MPPVSAVLKGAEVDVLESLLAVGGMAGVAIALAAGVVQGLTGMGFAVVFTPLFVLVVPQPQAVVTLSLLLGAVLCLGVVVTGRRDAQPRRSLPLVAGGLVGTPLGVLVLLAVDGRVLLVWIAALALCVAAVGLFRLPEPVRAERSAVAAAGLLGGFLNGSTSMGGMPPALLVSIQRWPTSSGRVALAAFNLVSYTLGLAVAAVASAVDTGYILSGLWLLPPAVVGTMTGAVMASRLSREGFGRVLTCVVGLSGIGGLVSVWTM